MKLGIDLITEECLRQRTVEGYTIEHDDAHDRDELAIAASLYAMPDHIRFIECDGIPGDWPFENTAWKPCPDDRIKELVKSGAMIVAEINRLLRLKK